MEMKITSRLLIMMFVQYFMQGAWNMTMGLVLSSYGMASIIGNAYALLGVATIISPLFIGMVLLLKYGGKYNVGYPSFN